MTISQYTNWRVRTGGSNLNGGGYDSSVTSPGTDYSQQDSPQVTFDGTNVAATTSGVSDTITMSGLSPYTAAGTDVGNVLHIIAGTNFTAGWYTIIARSGSTWQLDRNCCTGAGSAMTGRMGGAWANFATNTTSALAIIVPGNTVYILGGASPSYGSPDYTIAAAFTPVSGSQTVGYVRFVADPNTPSNNGFDGRVLIFGPGSSYAYGTGNCWTIFDTLHIVASSATGGQFIASNTTGIAAFINCVFDQNGWDLSLINQGSASGVQSLNGPVKAIGCEIYSNQVARSTKVKPGISANHYGTNLLFCNIHDCTGDGVWAYDAYHHILFCIIAKNGGFGVKFSYSSTQTDAHHNGLDNCTIDGNIEDAIAMDAAAMMILAHVYNCLITNHPTGKYGINVATGSATANDRNRSYIDWNTYYGNVNDLLNLGYGANTMHGGSDPYVASATQNYTLV